MNIEGYKYKCNDDIPQGGRIKGIDLPGEHAECIVFLLPERVHSLSYSVASKIENKMQQTIPLCKIAGYPIPYCLYDTPLYFCCCTTPSRVAAVQRVMLMLA
jgi:hypothetical protein